MAIKPIELPPQRRSCLDCGFLTIQGRELTPLDRTMLSRFPSGDILPAHPEQTQCFKGCWEYYLDYCGEDVRGVIEEIEKPRDNCRYFASYEAGLTPGEHLEIQKEQLKRRWAAPEDINIQEVKPSVAIKESLDRFRADHPAPQKVAFLMMKFGKTVAHMKIVDGARKALDPFGIQVVRADDKQYNDDLFDNVLTYVHGCGFGVAVFERLESEELNPNVALEVGYMYALGKPVCLLKDKTLNALPTDLVGKLYKNFDPQDPIATIPQELSQWINDNNLQ